MILIVSPTQWHLFTIPVMKYNTLLFLLLLLPVMLVSMDNSIHDIEKPKWKLVWMEDFYGNNLNHFSYKQLNLPTT